MTDASEKQDVDACASPIDRSPLDIGSIDESYGFYKQLRGCPVQHSGAEGGFYWISKYTDVRAASLNKNFSSSSKGVGLPGEVDGMRLYALEQEAPEHLPAKLLYMEAFKPERLKALEPQLVRIANTLIDAFAAAGKCDLVTDFTDAFPVLGMSAAAGIEGVSVDRIHTLSKRFGQEPENRASVVEAMGALVLQEILMRRNEPRDDYLSLIANAELSGRKMNEAELARFMVAFFTAGHETTTSSLGTLLFNVLSRPDLKERLSTDDTLLDASIEEAVRLQSPFHAFQRTAMQPIQCGGTDIPAGATVRLCYAAANHDPAAFSAPEVFDPEREGPPQLGFGFGRHICAGAPLARLEMRVAVRTLLSRLPDIRPTSSQLDYFFLNGTLAWPTSCPASFTPV